MYEQLLVSRIHVPFEETAFQESDPMGNLIQSYETHSFHIAVTNMKNKFHISKIFLTTGRSFQAMLIARFFNGNLCQNSMQKCNYSFHICSLEMLIMELLIIDCEKIAVYTNRHKYLLTITIIFENSKKIYCQNYI